MLIRKPQAEAGVSDLSAGSEMLQSSEASPRRAWRAILISLVLALLSGAGGFYASRAGLVTLPFIAAPDASPVPALPSIAYVQIPAIIISLGPAATGRHLKFSAQLETETRHQEEVSLLLPRIVDVLNSYLRAVEPRELEDAGAITRLRGHMLRRIQIVTGEGRVRDLLIAEFVLN